MRNYKWALALAIVGAAVAGQAADHGDGPAVTSDPTADIADVYTWMTSDASRINLVMTVGRNVGTDTRFSDRVQYVFHTSSKVDFSAVTEFDVDVLCQFDAAQIVSCWVGDEFVTGNAGNGIVNGSGRLRVFAGRRSDPFFFNLAGFQATTAAVTAAASSLSFDPAGCPTLDGPTSTALVTQLRSSPSGGAAVDAFESQDVLALVVQVDKSLLTQGGPIFAVWGATHRR